MQVPILTKLHPNINQILDLEFSDGISGQVIFTPAFFRGPFHIPLQDALLFSQVKKDDLNMLMWPNGFGLSLFELHEWLATRGTAFIL